MKTTIPCLPSRLCLGARHCLPAALALLLLLPMLTGCLTVDMETNVAETTIELSISDSIVKASSVTLRAVPDNRSVYYAFDVMSREEYEAFGSDRAVMDTVMARLRSEYDVFVELQKVYESPQEYLASFEQHELYYGETVRTFSGLTSQTDYYGLAFAYDYDAGKPTGQLYKVPFTTKARAFVDLEFGVTIKEGSISVFPHDSEGHVDRTSPWIMFVDSTDEIREHYYNAGWYVGSVLNFYHQYGIIGEITHQGVYQCDYSEFLTRGENYTVIVFGYDGGQTTALHLEYFTY